MVSLPLDRLLTFINPRRRFGARVGWAVGIIVLVAFIAFSFLLGNHLREVSQAESGSDFAELAFQMTDKLDRGMFERYREIDILAALTEIHDPNVSIDDKRLLLEKLQATLPEYAWLGIANPDGSVLVATGGLLEGEDVSQRPWFIGGQQGMFVGDVHEALLLASLLPNPSGEPLRFVDVASPIYDDDGQFIGVLGAHLSWSWVSTVQETVLEPLTNRTGIEMLVLAQDGVVLLGSDDQQLQDMSAMLDAAAGSASGYFVPEPMGGTRYLAGYAPTLGQGDYPGLGWQVIVRQPLDLVLTEAYQVERNVLLGGVVAGIVSAVLAWWIAQMQVQPVVRLAQAADALKHGDENAHIPIIAGKTEVATLSKNFASLVDTLGVQNQELEYAADRIRVLHTIDRTVLEAAPVREIARLTLTFLASRCAFLFGRVLVVETDDDAGGVLAYLGQDEDEWTPDIEVRLPIPVLTSATMQSRVFLIQDLAAETARTAVFDTLLAQGVCAYLVVPLIATEAMLGAIHIASSQPQAFTQAFIEIAHEVADQLAIAIQQARYRTQIEQHTAQLEQRVERRTVELAVARDRAEAILSHDRDPIAVLSTNGMIEQVNPAFTSYFDGERELIGQDVYRLVNAAQAEALRDAVAAVTERGKGERLELEGTREGDQAFVVDVSLSPVFQGSVVTDVICSLRDITLRRQIESDVRAALEKERELSEVKSRFASLVSHEFRTPLSVIKSSASLVERYHDRMSIEKQQEYLAQIHAQVKHLVGMLDDVLTLSRADAVGIDVNLAPTDLTGFTQTMIDEMQQTTTQHQLLLVTSGDARPIALDTKLMRQVLENLLSNAIKYSPDGGAVLVELAYLADSVVLCVKDSGIGIPMADQSRLFQIFQRATNVGAIAGTGLGLSIVKQAIEAHGGTIGVESAAGQGTTFAITLPSAAASTA